MNETQIMRRDVLCLSTQFLVESTVIETCWYTVHPPDAPLLPPNGPLTKTTKTAAYAADAAKTSARLALVNSPTDNPKAVTNADSMPSTAVWFLTK